MFSFYIVFSFSLSFPVLYKISNIILKAIGECCKFHCVDFARKIKKAYTRSGDENFDANWRLVSSVHWWGKWPITETRRYPVSKWRFTQSCDHQEPPTPWLCGLFCLGEEYLLDTYVMIFELLIEKTINLQKACPHHSVFYEILAPSLDAQLESG